MSKEKRAKLLSIYKDWEKNILEEFLRLNPETNYSKPFINTQVFEENGKKNILVIGQEARSFFKSNDDIDAEYISSYVSEFHDVQINKPKHNNYLKTPFWYFIRGLSENYNILWNNLDKLHKYEGEETYKLTSTEELLLHEPFSEANKSLLQLEVDVLNPDVIVLVVGPHYYKSLFKALNLNTSEYEKSKPNKNMLVQQLIVDDFKSTQILWTYHPGYLNRISMLKPVLNKLKIEIG